jgi:hypothetical protein
MGDLISSMSGLLGSGFASRLSSSLAIPSISGGVMPLMTRKGFIDITTIETLGDPSIGWMRINRMARHYGLVGQWGECPREMIPEVAPQSMLDRIERIAVYSRRQAASKIEAKRVELALKQQGQQNAIDLIGPPRYYYRY